LQILPFVNLFSVGVSMDYLSMNKADLVLRNEQTNQIYAASLDYKAAQLQGKKIARDFLLKLQQRIGIERQEYSDALVKELLHDQYSPDSIEYQRLLQVLFDQMLAANCYDHYLPQTTHPTLAPILDKLGQAQLFNSSLQQILQSFQISERHALRLSQQELQLSLSEWRNRAKIVYAIGQIQQGTAIKRIALDLGYQHSSSFIEFFKRYTGQTPLQMK